MDYKEVSIPTIGSWAFQVEKGLFLSASDDGFNQGVGAAQKALLYLQGRDVGSIPITTPTLGKPVLNAEAARLLSLSVPINTLNLLSRIGKIYKGKRETRFEN